MPRLEQVEDLVREEHRDSTAGLRVAGRGLRAVRDERRPNRHTLLTLPPPEAPLGEGGERRELDRLVRRERCRRSWSASLGEVALAGDEDATSRPDRSGSQGRVLEVADPHGHVDALLDQVDHAVGEEQLRSNRRVPGEERRDERRDVAPPEGRRRRDMEVFSIRALPRALAELGATHPDVVPLAYEMHPETMQRHLADGLLDVGFTIGRATHKGIRVEILGTSPGRIVCGRDHPLYRAGTIGPADLGRHPFVVPRFFQAEHLPALDEFPEDRYARRVGATIELLQMGVELVVAGKLLGCFPELSVGHLVQSRVLRVLTGLRGLPKFELCALTREGVAPKRAVAKLVAVLRAGLLDR